MTRYKYIIGNQVIECSDISEIPQGISYESFEYTEPIFSDIIVPQEVQLWRARTVLKLLGMEQVIEVALNSLDEPLKTGALYIWQFGTTVERNSQTVLLLQTVLGLTDTQVDDIFIQAENIAL